MEYSVALLRLAPYCIGPPTHRWRTRLIALARRYLKLALVVPLIPGSDHYTRPLRSVAVAPRLRIMYVTLADRDGFSGEKPLRWSLARTLIPPPPLDGHGTASNLAGLPLRCISPLEQDISMAYRLQPRYCAILPQRSSVVVITSCPSLGRHSRKGTREGHQPLICDHILSHAMLGHKDQTAPTSGSGEDNQCVHTVASMRIAPVIYPIAATSAEALPSGLDTTLEARDFTES